MMQQMNQRLQQQIQQQNEIVERLAVSQSTESTGTKSVKAKIPSVYTGERDTATLEIWLFAVRTYGEAVNLTDEQMVKLALTLLGGSALAWWRHYLYDHTPPKHWKAFEEAICVAFKPENARKIAFNKLAACYQKGSVTPYATEFHAILLELPGTDNEMILDKFIRGLKPNTRNRVEDEDPFTLEKAIQVAERCDRIHHGENCWTPRQPMYTGQPAPMDLDVLHSHDMVKTDIERERERERRSGLCHLCKKAGHLARYCPQKQTRSKEFPSKPQLLNMLKMYDEVEGVKDNGSANGNKEHGEQYEDACNVSQVACHLTTETSHSDMSIDTKVETPEVTHEIMSLTIKPDLTIFNGSTNGFPDRILLDSGATSSFVS
jgi:hypothetical protein